MIGRNAADPESVESLGAAAAAERAKGVAVSSPRGASSGGLFAGPGWACLALYHVCAGDCFTQENGNL